MNDFFTGDVCLQVTCIIRPSIQQGTGVPQGGAMGRNGPKCESGNLEIKFLTMRFNNWRNQVFCQLVEMKVF